MALWNFSGKVRLGKPMKIPKVRLCWPIKIFKAIVSLVVGLKLIDTKIFKVRLGWPTKFFF